MDARSIIELLVKTWQSLAAGWVWIAVWGWIGHLVGDKKKRPHAGAWLGIMLGPIGIACISMLEDRSQPTRMAHVVNAGSPPSRVRIRRPGDPPAERSSRKETEMEEFNRRFDEGFARR